MTVQQLADELGVEPAAVAVIAEWIAQGGGVDGAHAITNMSAS
jgi:hypothetical protein